MEKIFDVSVEKPEDVSTEEAQVYVRELTKKYNSRYIEKIIFSHDENSEYLNAELHFTKGDFERIRRITGYLVGTLDRFNDAKREEVKDRVVHSI